MGNEALAPDVDTYTITMDDTNQPPDQKQAIAAFTKDASSRPANQASDQNQPAAVSATDAPHQPANFDIQAFEATRQIAVRQVQRLQELKKEFKIFSGQLQDLLENDQELTEADAAAEESTQKVKLRKAEIMETTEAKNIKLKISDLKEERLDIEDSLTGHLLDLYQTTGVMEFEDQGGEIWEYEFKSKIKTHKKAD